LKQPLKSHRTTGLLRRGAVSARSLQRPKGNRLAALGLSPLEKVAQALLDFQSLADLLDWWQPWQEQQGRGWQLW